MKIDKVPFEHILVDTDFNSRKDYDEDGIRDLAKSILNQGLLQPMGVKMVYREAEDGASERRYKLIYGFRRYKAIERIRAQNDGAFDEIPVVINEGADTAMAFRNLAENIDRKNLSAAEIAERIVKLINSGVKQHDIEKQVGLTQSYVSILTKIWTQGSPRVKDALRAKSINVDQAYHLATIEDEEEQDKYLEQILEAETATERRTIAHQAASDKGTKRPYANKGKPGVKQLKSFLSDVSHQMQNKMIRSQHTKDFLNGVAAGLRVAQGETDFEELAPTKHYGVDVSEEPVDTAAPAPKKRGRPKGKPVKAAKAKRGRPKKR